MAEAENHVARAGHRLDTATAVRRLVAVDPEIGAIELASLTLQTLAEAQAALEWKKREAAIEVLYKAFCNSELVTVVRLADGKLLQLAAWEWQGTALWHHTILSGVICALTGELAPYDRCPVFIETFESWLDRRTQSEPPEPLQQPAANEVIASVPPVEEEQAAAAGSTSAQPSAAEGIDPFNSGGGGRPTAMHIILQEAKRQIDDGVFVPRRHGQEGFAKELENWWKQENHDHYQSRGPKTTGKAIQNNRDFQNLWSTALAAASNPET
jgi:hypothetical protein